MHIFPAIISKLGCDVTGDFEAQRGCGFLFIHPCRLQQYWTVVLYFNYYEFRLIIVEVYTYIKYSNVLVNCTLYNLIWGQINILFLFTPTKHSRLYPAYFEKNCFDRDPGKMAALGYPGAKISLKEDDVPTLFPLLEVMLMP